MREVVAVSFHCFINSASQLEDEQLWMSFVWNRNEFCVKSWKQGSDTEEKNEALCRRVEALQLTNEAHCKRVDQLFSAGGLPGEVNIPDADVDMSLCYMSTSASPVRVASRLGHHREPNVPWWRKQNSAARCWQPSWRGQYSRRRFGHIALRHVHMGVPVRGRNHGRQTSREPNAVRRRVEFSCEIGNWCISTYKCLNLKLM